MQGLDGSNGRMPQWLPFVADFQKLPFVEDFHLSGANSLGQDMNRIINSMIFRNIAPKPTLKNNTLLSGKAK